MKIKSKTYKRLKEQHDYLNRKVKELTEDRKKDRSSESKILLMRLKKSKLALKDALAKDPSLQHEELFKEWASENSSILL